MLNLKHITHRHLFVVLCALFAIGFAACSDDNEATTDGAYDSTKPVKITDFVPKSGGQSTKLVLYGENFGNDTSKIKVFIGGKKAVLISSKNNSLYCWVPAKAFSGAIKVVVGDSTKTVQEAESAEPFQYTRSWVSGLLCGNRNEYNDQGWHDGPFETATGFSDQGVMAWDPLYPERLYITYDGTDCALHCIDFKKRYVSTWMHNAAFDNHRERSMAFTPDGKWMYMACDGGDGQHNKPVVYAVKRNDDGTFNDNCRKEVLARYENCNFVAIHPVNHEIYFNSFDQGQVWKVDTKKFFETIAAQDAQKDSINKGLDTNPNWKPEWTSRVEDNLYDANKKPDGQFKFLWTIQDSGWEFQMYIHPTGNYAYIVVWNQNYILRTDYDWDKKEFRAPYIVAGAIGQAGYADGVGTAARFDTPRQGVFVKNPDYVAEGKDDQYDFYFVELKNWTVRKMTPEGIVTTFAGRGNRTHATDNNWWGNDNGDLRQITRFRDISGIAYNESNETFYILDKDSRQIRTISKEDEDSATPVDPNESTGTSGESSEAQSGK